MAITPLPTPPNRSMAAELFATTADTFLSALPQLASEIDLASIAMNNNSTNSTSTTSILIATGSISLTVQTAKGYVVGQTVKIASTASPTNWMLGDVTAYTSGTGALVVSVNVIQGSGTFAAWTVSLAVSNAGVGFTLSDLQKQAKTGFTSAGTAPAFTVSTAASYGAHVAGQRMRVKFHAAGTTGSNTLNRDGLGALSIKQYDYKGTKVPAVVTLNQLADIEYDGTEFVILDPLPNLVTADISVRQTVSYGPVDSNGYPSFLPATSASLSLTSQNITGTIPLIVNSANALTTLIGSATSNLTWSGLTANTTNYLYVNISTDGVLTTGSTTLAPVYQFGGTRSVTNGQATFNVSEMYLSVGNGSSAVQTYRVYVGEAVTNATTVTSTVAYAYQAKYTGQWINPLPAAGTAFQASSNIGFTYGVDCNTEQECVVADGGFSVGDSICITAQANATYIFPTFIRRSNNTVGATAAAAWGLGNKTTGVAFNPVLTSWKCRFIVKRSW